MLYDQHYKYVAKISKVCFSIVVLENMEGSSILKEELVFFFLPLVWMFLQLLMYIIHGGCKSKLY
jgi:hypothetical protein